MHQYQAVAATDGDIGPPYDADHERVAAESVTAVDSRQRDAFCGDRLLSPVYRATDHHLNGLARRLARDRACVE